MGPPRPFAPQVPDGAGLPRSGPSPVAEGGEWLARSGYGVRWSTDEPPPPALWEAFLDALCAGTPGPGDARGLRAACDQRLRDALHDHDGAPGST